MLWGQKQSKWLWLAGIWSKGLTRGCVWLPRHGTRFQLVFRSFESNFTPLYRSNNARNEFGLWKKEERYEGRGGRKEGTRLEQEGLWTIYLALDKLHRLTCILQLVSQCARQCCVASCNRNHLCNSVFAHFPWRTFGPCTRSAKNVEMRRAYDEERSGDSILAPIAGSITQCIFISIFLLYRIDCSASQPASQSLNVYQRLMKFEHLTLALSFWHFKNFRFKLSLSKTKRSNKWSIRTFAIEAFYVGIKFTLSITPIESLK